MRLLLLFIALICLGLQFQILMDHEKFMGTFFPGTDDPLGLSIVAVFALGAVEALIVVVWLTAENFETDHYGRAQTRRDSADEDAQTSSLPRVRGRAISNLINAQRDRENIILALWSKYGWPFLFIALVCVLLGSGMLHIAMGGN